VRQEVGPANLMLSMSRADGVAIFHVHWMGAQRTDAASALVDDSNHHDRGAAGGGGDILLCREPIDPPAPGETITLSIHFDQLAFAPGLYRLSWALYPAEVGGFPAREEDYPYDCHLRTVEFGIAMAPGEEWGESGAIRLAFEAQVEELPAMTLPPAAPAGPGGPA
jgi:hypothetical protein